MRVSAEPMVTIILTLKEAKVICGEIRHGAGFMEGGPAGDYALQHCEALAEVIEEQLDLAN